MRQQILRCAAAGNLFERGARVLQVGEDEFFRQRTAVRSSRLLRPDERVVQ